MCMHDLLIFSNAPGISLFLFPLSLPRKHATPSYYDSSMTHPDYLKCEGVINRTIGRKILHLASHPASMTRKCEPYTPSSMPRKCVQGDLLCMHEFNNVQCMKCDYIAIMQ